MCRNIHPVPGRENLTRSLHALEAACLLMALAAPAHAGLTEPTVDSILVTGVLPAPLGDLLEGTEFATGSSLLRTTPNEVREGIVYNLREMGFLDPVVDVQWPSWDDGSGIVRIAVDPGTRSLLSGLVIEGSTLFGADTLASLYRGSPGSPITPSDTFALRSAVLDLYGRRGRISARVRIDLQDLSPGEVVEGGWMEGWRALDCIVEEGPMSRLGSVTVDGLRTVREKVILRELLISPGDSLDMELLRQSVSAIYQLGLFQDVRFSYSPTAEDSSLVDLRIMVTESEYRRVDIGGGYMSPHALFGSVRWMHPNIMGNNQVLTTGIYYMTYVGSEEGRRIEPEVVYEEPWFLSTRWWMQLRGGYLDLHVPGLEQRSWSITASFARNLSRTLRLTTGYSLEYERYAETAPGDSLPPEESDWTTTSSISASLVHDTRSPILDPHAGHWLMGGGKLSGGFLGGTDYYRIVGETRFFLPAGDALTLAGRLRAGASFPYGDDTSVPPDDRFFLGGGTTVRGYSYGSLGPRDAEGNPIGGKMELLGNFEVRMAVAGGFGVVLFTDAGGLWNSLAEIDLDTSGFGTGFGLRYSTVFGPLRLDYGFAPTWSNALRRGKVTIGIGQIF